MDIYKITYIYIKKHNARLLNDFDMETKRDGSDSMEYWIELNDNTIKELLKVGVISEKEADELSNLQVDTVIFFE